MKKFIKRLLVGVVLPLTAIALFFTTWQVNQNTAAIVNNQHSLVELAKPPVVHEHALIEHTHEAIEHTHEVSE